MDNQTGTDKEQSTGLRGAATLAAVATVATLLAPRRAEAVTLTYANSIPGTGDTKVINYAYVLQDFEAKVYQAALTKLTALSIGSGNAIYDTLAKFAPVETDHASYLSGIGQGVSFSYAFPPIANATTAKTVLEFVLQVETTVTRGMLATLPLLTTGSTYITRLAAIQSVDARHATTLTYLHNAQFQTTTDVTPLPAENNLNGSFTFASFGYEQYNPTAYNPLKPNEGVIGIEANLMPDTVLASLISPYVV